MIIERILQGGTAVVKNKQNAHDTTQNNEEHLLPIISEMKKVTKTYSADI